MTQPFDEGNVLYRFTPSKQNRRTFWIFNSEFVIVRDVQGIRTYIHNKVAGWVEDCDVPHNDVIDRLIKEREVARKVNEQLEQQCDIYLAELDRYRNKGCV